MSSNSSSAGGVSRSLTMGFIGSCLLLSALLAWGQNRVSTHITPDNSLGTTVTPNGRGVHTIAGGRMRGPNLFHSFDRFDVGKDNTAQFTGPNTIDNIISRVTGGHVSNIDGTIRSEIWGANLYLLNPSGVVFGPHANLEVSGALHVSTADRLHFADGAIFAARLGEASMLTSAPPVAFGFLGPRAAPISIHHLVVPGGNNVSIIGGDIAITQHGADFLTLATQGQVSVVSVASRGQVRLPPAAQPTAFEVNGFARLGTVTVSDAAFIAGRTVVMRAEHLAVNHATIRAFIPRESNGPTRGIDIQVKGDVILTEGAGVLSELPPEGMPGDALDIHITAGSVHLKGVSVVRSSAGGASGNITVTADSVRLAGDSGVSTTSGSRAAGDITVTVQQLTLVEGSQISASTGTNAPGGTVSVKATNVDIRGEARQSPNRSGIFSAAAGPVNRGAGGAILMEVGTLTLRDGGVISTTTESQGPGGRVSIQATEAVMIAGRGEVSGQPSALLSQTNGPGVAGAVQLRAPRVHLGHGGIIAAESTPEPGSPAGPAGRITVRAGHLTLTGGGRISSSTQGDGGAGRVRVRVTDTVSIAGQDSGLFSDTAGRAMGGDIDLQAHTIELADSAAISAQSTGLGNAGTLTITARDTVLLREDSAITTLAEQAGGGNITLRGSQLVRLTDNSRVTAEARGEARNDRGGNVTVSSTFVILDHSLIQANAFAGNGGNITVNATEAFLADVETCANPTACLDASSQLSNPGRVEVQSPVTDLSSIVVPLPQRFAQTAELLRQHCAERFRGGEVSSFILAGREQAPIEPDGVLPSPPSMGNNMTTLPTKAERQALSGVISTEKSKEQASLSVAFDLDCSKVHAETRRRHTK